MTAPVISIADARKRRAEAAWGSDYAEHVRREATQRLRRARLDDDTPPSGRAA